jgi:hypothetical protein
MFIGCGDGSVSVRRSTVIPYRKETDYKKYDVVCSERASAFADL